MFKFDHLAIQTDDIENTVRWYKDFFHCEENWKLTEFSDLTLQRLPSITKLVELQTGNFKIHIFDINSDNCVVPATAVQYQHFCIEISEINQLEELKTCWLNLYESGLYKFKRHEKATDIVTDKDGISSFYCYDINGLEFEVMYKPQPKKT
ncbi:VOC family protein [Nostoc sp.]|uniref:VOC family protein n=1 Tax=Nostoc sp. TaxID=1180 RepID=UPI002FF47655